MTSYAWVVHDAHGTDVKTTPSFATKEEAENWMGAEWATLLAEGGESVSLKEDDKVLYKMGLRAE